jgi:hypothetical protein
VGWRVSCAHAHTVCSGRGKMADTEEECVARCWPLRWGIRWDGGWLMNMRTRQTNVAATEVAGVFRSLVTRCEPAVGALKRVLDSAIVVVF